MVGCWSVAIVCLMMFLVTRHPDWGLALVPWSAASWLSCQLWRGKL